MEIIKDRSDVANLVKDVADSQGFKNYEITKVVTNPKGEGYLGEIFMITIADNKIGKELAVVIKCAFKNEKVREFAPIRATFENEIFFYCVIYPAFVRFGIEKGVEPGTPLLPLCYKVSMEDRNESLVLENLIVDGFEIFEKTQIVDHDHIKLICETYGRLHAYSLAIKDENEEEFKRLGNGLQNIFKDFMLIESPFCDYVTGMSKIVQSILIPGEDDDLIEIFEPFTPDNILKVFIETIQKHSEYSVIIHGDCWSNNMMFKYQGTGNEKRPIEMRLLDLQLSMIGSPILDLSYAIYSGSGKEVYDNLDEYLQIYYDSLSWYIKKMGRNPEKLFSFEKLKEEWKFYSQFGVIMAILVFRMKATKSEDVIDLAELSEGDYVDAGLSNSPMDEKVFTHRVKILLRHIHNIYT